MNEDNIKAEILENNEKTEEAITGVTVKEKTEKKKMPENEAMNKKEDEQYKFHKRVTSNKKKNSKIIIISIIFLIFIALFFSTIFAIINSNNVSILKGISIRNISVQGMTINEALNIITEKSENNLTKEILIKANGEEYSITPEQIEVQYKIQEAVDKAYDIGRDGNIIQNNFAIIKTMFSQNNIDLEFTYNEELLENILDEMNTKLSNAMVDNTYCVEEDKLTITRGKAGYVIDSKDAKEKILEAIKQGTTDMVELKTEYSQCPEIDIDKIYSEVKTEPQNASYKTDPFEIIPHKNGIDFDLEEARKLLTEEKEEYIIILQITEPEIHTNEIGEEAFPDLLSSFSTKYDETNVSRSKNLKIAMSKLDGVVIMPGETFSYNKTLGKRTVEEGYEYANGFAAGKVVPMLAGGICQISSTLYDAALYANLKIVERHNHMFQATYVEPGKDATVVYGSLDFKFQNTRSYPIMIKTKCGGGLAEIKIFGIKEQVEYEIEIISTILSTTPYSVVYQDDTSLTPGREKVAQWGLKGCKSITHRIVKLNGQEVSREVLSTDSYSPLNKIVRRGVSAVSKTEPETPTETTTPTTPTEPEEPTTSTTTEEPTEPIETTETAAPITTEEPIPTPTPVEEES